MMLLGPLFSLVSNLTFMLGVLAFGILIVWAVATPAAHAPAAVIGTVGTVGTVIALVLDPTIVAAAIVTVLVALTASVMAVMTKLESNKKAARDDAAALAIELAKISRSVDGVATRQVDKVTALEARITDLTAQLAAANNTASTLAAVRAAVDVAAAAPPPTAPKG